MKTRLSILFLISLLTLIFGRPLWAAECGTQAVTLKGASAIETQAVCQDLAKVSDFFRELRALPKNLTITFIFENQVLLPAANPEDRVPVHGYFDTDDNSIHMTHFDSSSQTERMPWGFVWTEEMASSFLLHEISHLYAISYMGNSFRSLPHHWHEFFAYSVQFELMNPELRARILQFTSTAEPFDSPASVSSFFYEVDPEKYAIRAYRSTESWGNKKFLKNLLDLKY